MRTHLARMGGRVKRRTGLIEAEALRVRAVPVGTCALCERPFGSRTEWHHPLPKSRGGTDTVPVHPICHRIIHASVSNKDLATLYPDTAALRSRDDVGRFLRWIRDKPPDFDAPTRRGADRR